MVCCDPLGEQGKGKLRGPAGPVQKLMAAGPRRQHGEEEKGLVLPVSAHRQAGGEEQSTWARILHIFQVEPSLCKGSGLH